MATKRNNPFGSLSDLATEQSLALQKDATRRMLAERRRATIGPVNTIALQFGEALGNLIRKKGFGNLTAQERQAAENTDILTLGMERGMQRIKDEGLTLGSPEARRVVLEEQFAEAMRSENLEAATALSDSLLQIQEHQLRMADLKAGTDLAGAQAQRLSDQTLIDLLALRRKQEANATARATAAEKGEDALRKEVDQQIETGVEAIEALERMEGLATQNTRAGDLGLIFNTLKLFDPNSKVTDQDFATIEGAKRAILDSENIPKEVEERMLRMITTRTKFTDYERAQILNAARAAGRGSISTGLDIVNDATSLARDRQYDIAAVLSGRANRLLNVGDRIAPISTASMEQLDKREISLSDVLKTDEEIRREAANLPEL